MPSLLSLARVGPIALAALLASWPLPAAEPPSAPAAEPPFVPAAEPPSAPAAEPLPAPAAASPSPVAAELRVLVAADAVMRARVEERADGHRLVIRCDSGCPVAVEHAEDIPEVPLGLFQIWDGRGLLLSTWAAASVYVVRAHHLTPRGVRPVLEATSRGTPEFGLDRRGRIAVRTSERLGGARDGLRTVSWRWDGARFRRGGR